MKRIIVWASQHLEIDTLSGGLHNPDDPPEPEYFDNSENYGESELKAQKIMSTPFGLWRVDDVMNPYKQFKLWMGHTNFTVSAKIAQSIKTTPGVEVLTILTRYRFMIGIGELFDIRDVRVAIEKSLKCNQEEAAVIEDPQIQQQVEHLKKKLSQHNNWAIYVFPNGKIDFITDDGGPNLFSERIRLYRQAVDHSSGILIEKNNEQSCFKQED